MTNIDKIPLFAPNIVCEYLLEPPQLGESNEYLQSMFLGSNKGDNEYPCKAHFTTYYSVF